MKMIELKQTELQEVFEIVDGQIWRKEYVSKDGRNIKRRVFENIVNHHTGYCYRKFKGRMVGYHRIMWVLVHGDIPNGLDIDHIDGNRLNNDISNLRLVTRRQNCHNMKKHRKGKLVGCTYVKDKSKWRANIWINSKVKFIGYFNTEQEAHEAYKAALSLEEKRV